MMPARQSQQSSCEGKMVYETHGQAIQACTEQSRRRLNAYRCRHCGQWHVGGSLSKGLRRPR